MSEYQYYEFLAVDRPLNRDELASLRALSTRAHITPTSFVNHYEWGDFKGNPDRLVECCFDCFLYLANWGSRRFMLRIPEEAVEPSLVKRYCPGDRATMRQAKGFIILDYLRDDEDGDDWNDDGQGWMATLAPVRSELIRGDLRLLYLGWLLAVQEDVLDADDLEPPPLSGLADLSGPLQSFMDFMGIDGDLVQAAASGSPPTARQTFPDTELLAGIRALSEDDKVAYLLRMVRGDDPHAGAELRRRLEKRSGKNDSSSRAPTGRTVGELQERANAITRERQRRDEERQAAERMRREQQATMARATYLDQLATREDAVWREVAGLIASRSPGPYDRAVTLLVDLREVAVRGDKLHLFMTRLQAIRTEHARKPSLIGRLDKAGLTGHD